MKQTLVALSVAAVAATAAIAQEEDTPASVEARHGVMENFAFNISTLGAMAKGEAEYDAEMAQAAAERLVVLSNLNQSGYWPEGTSTEEVDESRALPAIWENMEDFESGFGDLHEAAMSMQEVAGDGQEAIAGQMQALGQSCGGCHEDYRQSDD